MSFVMDCSLALSWYFSDEATDSTQALREQLIDATIYVPALWPLEVTNAVLAVLRRKRISQNESQDLLTDLRQLPDEIDRETDAMVWDDSFSLAKRLGLSVYDATYLELAKRKDLPLATLDKALAKASLEVGVEVLI